ncbi:MAG: class I SAM-dependent methyltransferase [Pirellulaceae bacterium]|nr:class I SAM-dependent methyltransferase [Pirellulaceae bacterium]
MKPIVQERGYQIYRCRNCGLAQVRPIPQDTTIENSDYWHVNVDDPQVQVSRLGSQKVFAGGIDKIEQHSGLSVRGKKLLDVGCGMGLFLEVAQQRGAAIHGIDLTPEAVQFTRKLCGVDTIQQGSFESSDYAPGSFEIITGWNMLHSVNSPTDWLKKAHQLLSDHGILLLKVPNITFFNALHRLPRLTKLLGIPKTPYLTTVPPLALYGYSTTTLSKLLRKANFDVLWVGCSPINERRGMHAKLSTALSTLATASMGHVNYHPVIMAVARKR